MGHTLSLFGRFSLKGTRMVATYRGAESVEGEIPIFVSAFRESQDRESLDFIRSGIGVQVTRRVLGRNVFLRYDLTTSELFNLKINPIQIDRNFADNLWLSAVSASVVTDTRDDPVDPRRGRFGIVDVEWSSALLRSRAPFVKGLGQQYLFFPVGEAVVLAVSGRLGLAWTLGADEPALVPITERFFAGGATSLRGYKLDRAGPLDPSGYPVGGTCSSWETSRSGSPSWEASGARCSRTTAGSTARSVRSACRTWGTTSAPGSAGTPRWDRSGSTTESGWATSATPRGASGTSR